MRTYIVKQGFRNEVIEFDFEFSKFAVTVEDNLFTVNTILQTVAE